MAPTSLSQAINNVRFLFTKYLSEIDLNEDLIEILTNEPRDEEYPDSLRIKYELDTLKINYWERFACINGWCGLMKDYKIVLNNQILVDTEFQIVMI